MEHTATLPARTVTRGRGFLLFSIATIVAVISGGALAGTQVARVAAGLPSPFLGLIERLNIYATMLWIAVLSIVLLGDRAARLSEEVGA